MVKYHQCPTRKILSSLIMAIFWLHLSQGASVNLTVEGGVNLVDENCPGIVRLFCEAVDTNQLRWRYNEDTDIIIYFSDHFPSQPSQIAFLTVELLAISQNTIDRNRANFTSILTANLSQLQSNNVTEIECGDANIFQIKPVNVQIIDRSRPRIPSFSMVTTEYQSERLNSVRVQWRKSENFCPEHGLTFIYQVNVTAERSISINHDNCSNNFCNATFEEIGDEIGPIKLSILVTNELGSSELLYYPYTIDYSSQQYFTPQVSFTNDRFVVECKSTALTTSSQTCGVRYTTDPLFRELSTKITSMLDKQFTIPGLSADTTYFFEFALLVNGSLQVVDRVSFTPQTSIGLPGWGIALIAIGMLIFGMLIFGMLIFVGLSIAVIKKNKSITQDNCDGHRGFENGQEGNPTNQKSTVVVPAPRPNENLQQPTEKNKPVSDGHQGFENGQEGNPTNQKSTVVVPAPRPNENLQQPTEKNEPVSDGHRGFKNGQEGNPTNQKSTVVVPAPRPNEKNEADSEVQESSL